MSNPNLDEATALVADPTTDAAILAEIAQHHTSLHSQIAAHPNVYPGLTEWMASVAPASVVTKPTGSWLTTQWTAHRTRSIVAIAATAALVLGGGGTAFALTSASRPQQQETASDPSKPKPTPTKTVAPVVVKPTGSMVFPIDQSAGLISEWDSTAIGPNSFVIAGGESEQTETSITFTTVAVTEDEPLVQTTAYAAVSDADFSISSTAYGAQQSATLDSGFVVAMTVDIPVSGVTPASTVLQVLPFAAGASSATKMIELPWTDGSHVQSVLLVGDVAVIQLTDDSVIAVDTASGDTAWTAADFEQYTATDRLVVGATGRSWNSMTGGDYGQLVALDAKTGQVAWTWSGDEFIDFTKDLGSGYGLVSTSNGTSGAEHIITLSDGKEKVLRNSLLNDSDSAISCFYDPTLDSFVMVTMTAPATYEFTLEVISAKDGSVGLTVSGPDYSALGEPTLYGGADGRAWVSTDNFNFDVFSTTTGEQDPLSPAIAGNENTLQYAPVYTNGSVSLLVGDYSKQVVVIHQNQPLTMALIATAG